ncbi:MAG: hypothetical protein P8Y72_17390 [Anaerolineales bacterium]
MHNFTSKALGRLSLSIVILSPFGVVFLILFFIGDFNQIEWLLPFGPANDVISLTISILTCVMAVMLLPSPRKQPVLFIAFLILIAAAWVGAAIVTVYSLREGVLMPDNIYYTLKLKYGLVFITDNNGLFGQGLIGLWLTAVNIYAYIKKFWPRPTAILGAVSGVIQLIGLFGLSAAYWGVGGQVIWNFLLGRWIIQRENLADRPLDD